MRRLLVLFCYALVLLAQNPNTAKFPGGLATDQDLLVGKDQSASTLAAGIGSTDTAIPVADGSKFLGYEVVTIDAEQILVCSVSVNTLNVCTGGRGFAGTTAANHSSGAAVRGHITAWHHNQVAAEVKAIETQLGASMANIVPSTRNVGTTAPLSGGGNLTVDRTLSCPTCEVTGNKNTASGYAGLDADSRIAKAQAPSTTAYTDQGNTWSVAGGVTLDNQLGVRLRELTANGTDYIEHRAAANLAGPATYTWPAPSAGFLKSAAGGDLSLAAASGTGACTNQFVRALNDAAAPTCAAVGAADVAISNPSSAQLSGVSSTNLATANKTGQVTYSFVDVNNDLPATLDVPSIYPNRSRPITITEVYCEINAGSASINLQRDDGTPANILSADLACSTAGATSSSFSSGEDAIAVGQNIDHVTVSVGAGLRRLNVAIKYTVN